VKEDFGKLIELVWVRLFKGKQFRLGFRLV